MRKAFLLLAVLLCTFITLSCTNDNTKSMNQDNTGSSTGVENTVHAMVLSIKDCYNYGDITGGQATSLTTSTSKYNGESRAGSIAGYYTTGISPFADCEGTITQCHVGGWLKNASYSKNWKEVTSSTYGGLIVGRGDDPTDCYFAPFVEAPQPE